MGHKTFLLLDINPLIRTLHLALRLLLNLSHLTPSGSCLSSPPTGASWGPLPTVWPNPRLSPLLPGGEISFLRDGWSPWIQAPPSKGHLLVPSGPRVYKTKEFLPSQTSRSAASRICLLFVFGKEGPMFISPLLASSRASGLSEDGGYLCPGP